MRGTVCVFAGLLAVSPALAEESETKPASDEAVGKLVELEKTVAQHKKEKDEGGLAGDLAAIAALHKTPDCPPEHRARLCSLVGVVLQEPVGDGVVKTALATVGDIGDDGNWKNVRRYLKQPDPKAAPPLLEPAIEAAGKIRAAGAVEPLLRIVEDSKVYGPAAAAIRALGSYGEQKRMRAKILESIVKSVRRSVPGGRGMKKGGQSSIDPEQGGSTNPSGNTDATRWGTLAPALVDAANRLTGKTAASAEDWFELYDRYKGKLDALFEK